MYSGVNSFETVADQVKGWMEGGRVRIDRDNVHVIWLLFNQDSSPIVASLPKLVSEVTSYSLTHHAVRWHPR